MKIELLRPLRISVFAALAIPAAMLARGYLAGEFASPFRTIVQESGLWSIRMLVLGLLIGPLRDLTGWQWPLALRRMIGLYAAFYAAVHVIAWTRQYGFDWAFLAGEIVRPWLLVGAAAALALMTLAATSPGFMHRRLGASWGRIHKLVYAAAILSVIHFALARGLTRPEMIAEAVAVVLALLWRARSRRLNAAAPSPF